MEKLTTEMEISDTAESDDITDGISSYVDETNTWIDGILTSLGWTREYILQDADKRPCPHNEHHYLPTSSMKKHKESCKLMQESYTREDLKVDQSSDFFYEKSTTVVPVKLGKSTDPTKYSYWQLNTFIPHKLFTVLPLVTHINEKSEKPHIVAFINNGSQTYQKPQREIPKTMDRYFKVLSPAERLRIYEYCIQSAKATEKLQTMSEQELMLLSETGKKDATAKPKSRIEMLMEERNQKRRRQSYKKVHSGKKSHLDVIKEVIGNQMEILQEIWDEEHEEKLRHEKQNRRSRSRDKSRERSRDRSPERSRDKALEKARNKSRERTRDMSRATSRDKSQERSRDKSQATARERSQESSPARSKKTDRDEDKIRPREKSSKKKSGKHRKRSRSQSKDRSRRDKSEKRRHRSRSRSRDRHEVKKKKKHKSRD